MPKRYFKVIYDTHGKAAAFIMQQSAGRNDDYCQKKVSLDDIQQKVSYSLTELEVERGVYERLSC